MLIKKSVSEFAGLIPEQRCNSFSGSLKTGVNPGSAKSLKQQGNSDRAVVVTDSGTTGICIKKTVTSLGIAWNGQ